MLNVYNLLQKIKAFSALKKVNKKLEARLCLFLLIPGMRLVSCDEVLYSGIE